MSGSTVTGVVVSWFTSRLLIDFLWVKNVERPLMELRGCTVSPQVSHRFLGVMLNQELRWRQHADHTHSFQFLNSV